jgi:hypothetical protein
MSRRIKFVKERLTGMMRRKIKRNRIYIKIGRETKPEER